MAYSRIKVNNIICSIGNVKKIKSHQDATESIQHSIPVVLIEYICKTLLVSTVEIPAVAHYQLHITTDNCNTATAFLPICLSDAHIVLRQLNRSSHNQIESMLHGSLGSIEMK